MKQKIAHYTPWIISLLCLVFLFTGLFTKPYSDQEFDLNRLDVKAGDFID